MAELYGVDSLRLAVMFGAPPEADLNFDEQLLQGMKNFLDKVGKFEPRPQGVPIDALKKLLESELKIE